VEFVIDGDPIGAPRMTRADAWRKRPCVVAYHAWCDLARRSAGTLFLFGRRREAPLVVVATGYFTFPDSYGKRKRLELAGQPHRVKPDPDNVGKALLDALFTQDQQVADLVVRKRWDDGNGARLHVVLEY
jgi:hypothetical protein